VQELQMTTLGNNITALAVQGNFDDCQLMVKKAFVDTDITKLRRLTSANSINVARWLPQMLYYIAAYQNLRTLGDKRLPVFSVPSGNFGNICAGLMARSIGLPVSRFIAATNVNDTVVRFLNDMGYQPNPTVPTLSNAMDVSDVQK
jgi:threonine synthase